ncbi:MAG: hypothetical protein CMQ14_00905 [Gammaproteobacteria bacterium]|nr:hypothetical protein [Gammaproteobacteria bacterium]|tara:strand:- start:3595 stop:4509 length:915 start_codon:yes stop_codon:yes gene_type:complete
MRNDPEQLEREARELMEQAMKAGSEPDQDDGLEADTSEQQEEQLQEAPTESVDTAEEIDAEAQEPEEDRGETQLDDAVTKAEQRVKNAQAKMTKALQETSALRKHLEKLQGLNDELSQQLAAFEEKDNRLEEVRENYPDIAGPLLDALEKQKTEVQQTREALAERQRIDVEKEQNLAIEEHWSRIREVHPDADDLIVTSEWNDWLEEQTPTVQRWVNEGSSNDAISVLAKFKTDLGIGDPTPQEKVLAKARKVAEPKMPSARKTDTKSGKKTWTVDEIKRMPNREFEKHQAEILEAYAQNQIRS